MTDKVARECVIGLGSPSIAGNGAAENRMKDAKLILVGQAALEGSELAALLAKQWHSDPGCIELSFC